ncbi:hypothetical protein LIER_02583 [Lithospermum erythrorhizon]|uniref:Uncharacterized protein n=1 Tax=Lithospermum erythrorhizon TaxID=34254 RepID=A0AAV3NSK5_LITER
MGGVCSAGVPRKRDEVDVEVEHGKDSSGFSGKLKSMASLGKKNKVEESYPTYPDMDMFDRIPNYLYDSTELGLTISRELKPSTPARTTAHKAHHVSSFLGKAGTMSLEKAVDVLDTLGSSMSNLNSGGFVSGIPARGNKITILAFEVANTIAKGANLLQSLSEENIQFLKKEVLPSEGVQQLVSTDVKELLSIAASDKREEFDVFSREVIRFGNLCKDPQWHSLGRYFFKLDSDPMGQQQFRGEAEYTMQELTTLAQNTSELYHELHALDRFEQDYRRKLDELESLNLPRKGESLSILHSELKHQRKHVRSLKKKSLWSKSLEEVVEKLVDVVTFIHQEITEAFGDTGYVPVGKELNKKPERLGEAGLALHYANIITQIDNIAARPTSLPPNVRDNLYHGLPPLVKETLRTRLKSLNGREELTVPQIKAEMEKTLQWLVPVATDTTKAHQGFGWVGEWANSGNDFGKKAAAPHNLIRLQTLYHAEKKKMDMYILELITLLNRLINLVRYRDNVPKTLPTCKGQTGGSNVKNKGVQLSIEDKDLLEGVMRRKKLVPGISKSQEFVLTKKKKTKIWALSKSTGSSPRRELGYPKGNILDILDGLDTFR